MNPEDGRPGRAGAGERPGVRHGRRRFRPAVAGLEGRQLLTSSPLSTVAAFHGTNQAIISHLVADGQGNLHGTTATGGEGLGIGDGTVFEIPAGSKAATTLASFDNSKGYGISGAVLDGQGNLYFTTMEEGGAHGNGKVFEIAAGSKDVTTLASFDGTNGEFPDGVIVDGQGNLYGTTGVGGADGVATVFEIARGSNAVTTLATFPGRGSAPKGLVVDGQGNLYGTNSAGGVNGAGSVYEIARGSNAVTTIASFDGLNGSGISNVAMDGQGNLYGTTEDGGTFGDGTVFEIARGSNAVTTLASFNNDVGTVPNPNVGVVVDGQGNLYGATVYGGTNNDGTVFEIARGSNTVTTLASFSGIAGSTVGSLMLDGQGGLYGTADGVGNANGTVFKLALNNQPTDPTPSTTTVEQTTTVVVTNPTASHPKKVVANKSVVGHA